MSRSVDFGRCELTIDDSVQNIDSGSLNLQTNKRNPHLQLVQRRQWAAVNVASQVNLTSLFQDPVSPKF